MMRAAVGLITLALLSGCSTSPVPEGGTGSAYAIGDRGRVVFDEVVVSLPLRGTNTPYHNLHVSLSAFVNPIRETKGYPWDAEGIVSRCEGRMAAKVSEALSQSREQSMNDTQALRQRAVAEAQAVVDDAMRRWHYGGDYRAEVVISSLYWTDPSVGRIGRQRMGFWD